MKNLDCNQIQFINLEILGEEDKTKKLYREKDSRELPSSFLKRKGVK